MTPSNYDAYMEVIDEHAAGRFLPIRFDHSRHLKGDGVAVLVLAFVLNLLRLRWANRDDRKQLVANEMWMRCPAGDIQEQLGMEEGRQKRAVDRLVEAKLLQTDHRKGNVLWVRIDVTKLMELEGEKPRKPQNAETAECMNSSCKMRDLDPAECGIPFISNKLSNKPTDTPPPSAAEESGRLGFPNGKKAGVRSSPGGRLARRLQEGLVQTARVDVLGTSGWPRHFNHLVERLMKSSGESQEAAADKIAALIDDHVQHYRDQFQPKANTAEKFCKRYSDIAEARERRERPTEDLRRKKPAADGTYENPNPKRYIWHPEYGILGEHAREEWDTSVVRKKVKGVAREGE